MPTDETRRILKVFGVAVTAYEDAVDKGSPEEVAKAEAEVNTRLKEVTELIGYCRATRSFSSARYRMRPKMPGG
jgi:hypothetical protein